MHRITGLLIFFCLFQIVLSRELKDKKAIFTDGLTPHFKLEPFFGIPSRVVVELDIKDNDGCIEKECDNGKVDKIFRVSLGDGQDVKVCICPNPVSDVWAISERFGQVDLTVRTPVLAITAATKGKGGGAYTMGQIAVYFDLFPVSVYMHESAHSLDFATGISSDAGWTSAINGDSCVPDYYAQTNEVEDWAQAAVMSTWNFVAKNDNDRIFDCWKNQQKFARTALSYGPRTPSVHDGNKYYITSKSTGAFTYSNTTTALGGAPFNNQVQQQYWLFPSVYGSYAICAVSVNNNKNNCWDAMGGKDNANVWHYGKNAGANQLWHIQPAQNGFFTIKNRANGLNLGLGCGRNDPWAKFNNGTADCNLFAFKKVA